MNHIAFSKRSLLKASAGALACAVIPHALARTRPAGLPDKPIRFIVPYGAGGVLDSLARSIAEVLRSSEGLTVLVENRPGAGGNIAAEYVANASPDGTTLLFSISSVMPGNGVLYRSLRYDAQRGFVCLSQLCSIQAVFVVRSDLRLEDMNAFMRRATSASEPQLSIASIGLGSQAHIAQTFLQKNYKASLTHVPYKGEPALVNDMLGGAVDCSILSTLTTAEHIKSGRLRPLALFGERNPLFPNVPAFAELGFHEWFWSSRSPQAVFAGKDIDRNVAQYLGEVISASVNTDKVKHVLRAVAASSLGTPYPQAHERYEAYAQAYREAMLLTGITLE